MTEASQDLGSQCAGLRGFVLRLVPGYLRTLVLQSVHSGDTST